MSSLLPSKGGPLNKDDEEQLRTPPELCLSALVAEATESLPSGNEVKVVVVASDSKSSGIEPTSPNSSGIKPTSPKSSGIKPTFPDIKFTNKVVELIVVLSMAALIELWKPSRENESTYVVMIVLLMNAFYCGINAAFLNNKFPESNIVKAIVKAGTLIGLLSLLASFNLRLGAVLPPNLKWFPWLFFLLTFCTWTLTFFFGN